MKSHRHRQCASLRKLQLSKDYDRQMLGKRRDAQRKGFRKKKKRKANRTNTLKAMRRLLYRKPSLPFAIKHGGSI